tara:strand:- start:5214 stop:5741 length:528 start_codon:yes stop_codon:yes gene_type:complete
MNQITKKPSIQDLVVSPDIKSNIGKFQDLINQTPKAEWVKDHPFIKNYKYIPIERVEFLLRSIFQQWEWKVNDFKVIANAICVHGTLRVLHPVTDEWLSYDGLGAVDIQTSKGSNPTDFNSIVPNALQKNLPAAETYALKDAAEKLGEIFGGSLNRKDEIHFRSPYSKWDNINDK